MVWQIEFHSAIVKHYKYISTSYWNTASNRLKGKQNIPSGCQHFDFF